MLKKIRKSIQRNLDLMSDNKTTKQEHRSYYGTQQRRFSDPGSPTLKPIHHHHHHYNPSPGDTEEDDDEHFVNELGETLSPLPIPPAQTDIHPYQSRRYRLSKDDFVVIRKLGEGHFAKVLLVQKVDNGRLYAMKIVQKAFILDHGRVRDLFSERSVLKRSKHPFIVKLDYTFQSDNQLFFVMEYLEGGDFAQFLMESDDNRLTEEQARFYAAEMFLALQYLHDNGVVYRDLKPANILMDAQGHLCLADMGLCKVFNSGSLDAMKRCTSFVGSPAYVAPEVLLRHHYGNAVDWWSFGVILFRMLCGELPFRGKSVNEIFERILRKPLDFTPYPWVSPLARDLIIKLLQKNETKRLRGSAVKDHPFFAGVRWAEIFRKKHHPPRAPPSSNRAISILLTPTPLPKKESKARPTIESGGSSGELSVTISLDTASNAPSLTSTQQQLFRGFTFVGTDESFLMGSDGGLMRCRSSTNSFVLMHSFDSTALQCTPGGGAGGGTTTSAISNSSAYPPTFSASTNYQDPQTTDTAPNSHIYQLQPTTTTLTSSPPKTKIHSSNSPLSASPGSLPQTHQAAGVVVVAAAAAISPNKMSVPVPYNSTDSHEQHIFAC